MSLNAKEAEGLPYDYKEQARKLYVAGFNKETTDESELKSYFEKYGEVIDVVIVRDMYHNSRGFGFVIFADSVIVDEIIDKKMNGTTFTMNDGNGKWKLDVKKALPKLPRHTTPIQASRKVFVKDLPRDNDKMDEKELKKYFEYFGNVLQVRLPRDRDTNRIRGFASIVFEEEASADNCLAEQTHMICKKLCRVTAFDNNTQNRAYNQNRSDASNTVNGGYEWCNPATYEYAREMHPLPVNGVEEYMDVDTINRILHQAFLLGQQSGLEMIAYERNFGCLTEFQEVSQGFSSSAAKPLMQSLLPTPNNNSTQSQNLIHQAMGNHYNPTLVPTPQTPPISMTTTIQPAHVHVVDDPLDRIVQVLRGSGIDTHALLTKLLKENPSTMSQQVTSSVNGHLLGTTRQTTSRWGPPKGKDENHNRKYHPY